VSAVRKRLIDSRLGVVGCRVAGSWVVRKERKRGRAIEAHMYCP
jgi:hypothetical protein